MKLIHVAPAPGKRIINPFTRSELRPDVVPDHSFWRARADEGGVIISDAEPAPSPAPVVDLKPAKKKD